MSLSVEAKETILDTIWKVLQFLFVQPIIEGFL